MLAEARAILARHDEMLGTVTAAACDARVVQLGIPLELAPDLRRAVARFAAEHPCTRVIPRHLSMTAQLTSLRHGELDVSFMRERPVETEFDTMLVAQENRGVLLAGVLAARLVGPHGIALSALAGLEWINFPRSGSPAWYDELAATLRSHGIDTGRGPAQHVVAQTTGPPNRLRAFKGRPATVDARLDSPVNPGQRHRGIEKTMMSTVLGMLMMMPMVFGVGGYTLVSRRL